RLMSGSSSSSSRAAKSPASSARRPASSLRKLRSREPPPLPLLEVDTRPGLTVTASVTSTSAEGAALRGRPRLPFPVEREGRRAVPASSSDASGLSLTLTCQDLWREDDTNSRALVNAEYQ